jgi:hypothetical protein
MTRFFRNGRELTFRQVVRIVQTECSPATSAEEKESLNWLVKAAEDGELGAQTMLNDSYGIACAGEDGTSIWLPDGPESQAPWPRPGRG